MQAYFCYVKTLKPRLTPESNRSVESTIRVNFLLTYLILPSSPGCNSLVNGTLFIHVAPERSQDSFISVGAFLIELKLGNVGFEERGKLEYPEKNFSEQEENQQQTQSTYTYDENDAYIPYSYAFGLYLALLMRLLCQQKKSACVSLAYRPVH